MSHERYENPLITRYASAEMAQLFGDARRFGLWRRLWVILAEAEREMGLPISQEQIDELAAQVDNIDFAAAAAYERKLRHDVELAVRQGKITYEESGRLLQFYEDGLQGYTYLEEPKER